MRYHILIVILLLAAAGAAAQKPRKVTGEFITGAVYRYRNFPSRLTERRNVDVWLPLNYSRDRRYAVIYVNDGENLFDPRTSDDGYEWSADETMQRLINAGRVRDTIVVGIWSGRRRLEEFSPEKAFDEHNRLGGPYIMPPGRGSDAYLKFVVTELKPFIDKNYETLSDRANTFVMGSSMGALMAIYALSEYPDVFGGAACLSTQFPLGGGLLIDYLGRHLPKAGGHRIYFDYGTLGLDADYGPYQQRADALMKSKGYVDGKDWITRRIVGGAHDALSWSVRLYLPLEFLLPPPEGGPPAESRPGSQLRARPKNQSIG